MSTVPNAVRKQAEQAQKIYEEEYGEHQDTDNPALNNKAHEDDTHPVHSAPEVIEETLEEKYRKLEQAHKALQGKYNAEVPRLTRELRETQVKLEQAEKQATQAETQAADARQKLQDQLNRIRTDYGDDLADTIQSVAEAARPQDTNTPDTGSPTDKFWRSLRRQVKDFDEINTSAEFITWLQSPSPSGFTYQQDLNEAGGDLDVASVVAIFREFERAKQPKRPAANGPESQVVPQRRTQQQRPNQAPKYTEADFAKLQRDIQRGIYRGREAEARALEAEIHAAIFGSRT